MITEVRIEAFKRFKNESLELRPLTVLAGRNGAGKTSLIHALLLLCQAKGLEGGKVDLNGPFGLELGWFDEIVNIDSSSGSFSIATTLTGGAIVHYEFTRGDTELYARFETGTRNTGSKEGCANLQYISAERLGPRITYKLAALPKDDLHVGNRGEFSAQVLDKLGGAPVDVLRACPSEETDPVLLVKPQCEAWLSKIARPVDIDTSTFPGTDIATLSFRIPGSSWVRPTNMGFGVSYSLPIVLSCLIARAGTTVIVENPEAHLHPAGQSEMGMFLAQMAAAGVQIILETHSDHLINGVRRAIGESGCLDHRNVIAHYFADEISDAQPLLFTNGGGISNWPKGFFDQYQIDIAAITRIRRKQ